MRAEVKAAVVLTVRHWTDGCCIDIAWVTDSVQTDIYMGKYTYPSIQTHTLTNTNQHYLFYELEVGLKVKSKV